jgi:hypothetical protein
MQTHMAQTHIETMIITGYCMIYQMPSHRADICSVDILNTEDIIDTAQSAVTLLIIQQMSRNRNDILALCECLKSTQ